MKNFRRICFALVLTAAFSIPVLAGDMDFPPGEMGNGVAAAPGDMGNGGAAAPGDMGNGGAAALAVPVGMAILSLIQGGS